MLPMTYLQKLGGWVSRHREIPTAREMRIACPRLGLYATVNDDASHPQPIDNPTQPAVS